MRSSRDVRIFRRGAPPPPVAGLPTPPIPGLSLWLRGDLGITLNGGAVAAWADQSGAGNHVAQASGVRQPTFVAADANLNNRPSVRFNVSDNVLVGPSATFAWIGAVATHPAATFVQFPALFARDGANRFLIGNDATANWAVGGSAIAGTAYRNGAATGVALTGANAPQFYEFVPTVPTAGAFQIGGGLATILDWLGTGGEFFATVGAPPSAGNLLTLRAYLTTRYGFPA